MTDNQSKKSTPSGFFRSYGFSKAWYGQLSLAYFQQNKIKEEHFHGLNQKGN